MTFYLVPSEEYSVAVPWTIDRRGQQMRGVENSERIARIVSGLRAGGGTVLSCSASDGLRAERIVATIHGKRYLNYLRRSDGQDDDQGTVSAIFAAPGLAQDTPLVPGAWRMARAAAAATVRAAVLAVQDGINTYAVVRPPRSPCRSHVAWRLLLYQQRCRGGADPPGGGVVNRGGNRH